MVHGRAMPAACTLTPQRFAARMELIDALAADGLIDRADIPHGVRVRLRATPEIERRTRDVVAAEHACCAFLDFALSREPDALVLEITGPDEAGPMIARFFDTGATRACGPG